MISLNEHFIDITIEDRYATIDYVFKFKNNNKNKNGSDELKFDITIDRNAFISKFKADIDGEIFIGKIKEKQQASTEYIEAKENDENAILISQTHGDIPNVFTISTNIDGNSDISLTITIQQYIQKRFNFNVLDIQILRNFDKYSIQQNYDYILFTFNINDKCGIYNVNIPSSEKIIIDTKIMDKNEEKCIINGKIQNKISSLNEITLQYKIKGEEEESMVLFDRKSGTFCHIISDIMTDSKIKGKEGDNGIIKEDILIPRRVVFIIDKSGSMRKGDKWYKTIKTIITALKQLRNGYDRYGVVLFDNNIEILCNKGIITANQVNIAQIISYLDIKEAGGGTNINDALLTGIDLIKQDMINEIDGFYMNQIIFITDGEPNNGERDGNKIIANVKKVNDIQSMNGYLNKICIFSFGVGCDGNDAVWIKDLNHSFLKTLSINNDGFYRRIKQSNTMNTLNEYFKLLSRPILMDIKVKYNDKNIKNLSNTTFNALYAGNDIIICGKLETMDDMKQDITLNVCISAISARDNKPVEIYKEIECNINTNNDKNKVCDRIWAYLILQQMATKRLVYNDMIAMDDEEQNEQNQIPLQLAMKYKFITPWTSMIVVKKKQQNDINKLVSKSRMPSISGSQQQNTLKYSCSAMPSLCTEQQQQQQQQRGMASPSGVNNDGISSEFMHKIKEIEIRIIQHLHTRGYDEGHPDYHRYIAKAKELAIKKAGKAREKMIKQQKQRIMMEQQSAADVISQLNDYEYNKPQYYYSMKYSPSKPSKVNDGKLGGMKGIKGLIVLRGLPGSGKSTLAKKLAAKVKDAMICSEDRYHWSGQQEGVGTYRFQPNLVFLAREWCNKEITKYIANNVNLIIIDNHNAKISMYEHHIRYAVQCGYRFRIIEFVSNNDLCHKYEKRSYKQFPKTVYSKLLKLWECDPRSEIINPVFNENENENEDEDEKKEHIDSSSDDSIKNEDTDRFPKRYEVMIQARVRTEKEFTSQHITDLPEGSIVTVEEIIGLRARISNPLNGWLSIKSKYGARIIIPKNKQFAKIGGSVIFKKPIYRQMINGKIIDYDEMKKLYQIRYNDGNLQWIDLRDKNIFIKKKKNENITLNYDAKEFKLQTNESFFNQFFCRDYPQYKANSNSTMDKMEIAEKMGIKGNVVQKSKNINHVFQYSSIW